MFRITNLKKYKKVERGKKYKTLYLTPFMCIIHTPTTSTNDPINVLN